MDTRSGQIATICECIDHCFVFTIWCEDFAKFFDEEDIVAGLDRGAELMGEATRLMSFVALRKLDDFLRGAKSKPDDLRSSKHMQEPWLTMITISVADSSSSRTVAAMANSERLRPMS